ncbi:hypothetical protein D3C81_1728300 [compost metagenome]
MRNGGLAAVTLDQLRPHRGQPRRGRRLCTEVAQPMAQHGVGMAGWQGTQASQIEFGKGVRIASR